MQDQPAQPVQPSQVSPATTPPTQTSYVDAYTPPSTPLVPPVAPSNSPTGLAPSPVVSAPTASPAPVVPLTPIVPSVPPLVKSEEPPVTQQPLVSEKTDPQKALDDLAKMFEDTDVKPNTEPAQPTNVSPVTDGVAADYPVEQPTKTVDEVTNLSVSPASSVPTNPTASVPPVIEVDSQTPKSSEQLLEEIDQAIKQKQVDPNMVQDSLTSEQPVSPASNEPVDQSPAETQNLPDRGKLSATPARSETLEDQNIFHLLGIEDSSQEQKDQFLAELQQVIWEDFLDHDVELLLTDSEYQELKQTYHVEEKKPLAEQEEVIVFLEKLIPDLENLMLEKAIKLKADLVKERVTSLREKFATQPDKLKELDQADALINQEKWLSAGQALNALVQ